MSCGTMPCICSNCGVELGKAVALCSAEETRVRGCFVHPKGEGSLFPSRWLCTVSSEFALPATLLFGTAPNMHGQLGNCVGWWCDIPVA